MARRGDHSREELFELFIKAGIAAIEREGFHNFSARKVARSVGYTVGTIYHLFGDLDGFHLHINARTLDLWYDTLEGVARRARRRPINALANACIEFSVRHANRWAALYEHRLPQGRQLPEWYADKMNRLFALVEKELLPLTGKSQQEAKRTASLLWAGIHGISVLMRAGKLELAGRESAGVLAKDLVSRCLSRY